MKRLLILLILLLALPAYAQQCTEENPCPELARLSPAMMGSVTAPQDAAYFGSQASTGGYQTSNSGYTLIEKGVSGVKFVCPGTGNRTLDALEFYTGSSSSGVTPGNVRLAIYNTDSTLVCQWSSEVSVTNGSWHWLAGPGFTGSTTLVGGTEYWLAHVHDSSDSQMYYIDGTSGDSAYIATDYTGGFPDPIAAGTAYSRIFSIRAHVAAIP